MTRMAHSAICRISFNVTRIGTQNGDFSQIAMDHTQKYNQGIGMTEQSSM